MTAHSHTALAPTVDEPEWNREVGACSVYHVGMLAQAGVRWRRATCHIIAIEDPSGDSHWIARALGYEVRGTPMFGLAADTAAADYATISLPDPPMIPA
jgi:hypothetical protein